MSMQTSKFFWNNLLNKKQDVFISIIVNLDFFF